VDNATGCDRILYERQQAFGGSVANLAHANPADPRPIFLRSHDYQGFVQIQSAGQTLLQATDIAFVYLDSPREQIPSWSYHRAAQFMEHRPGGPVFFQPQHSLQSQSAGPILLGGQLPHRTKPNG
jgi:hypothetical protein